MTRLTWRRRWRRRAGDEAGQAFSEYVVVLGVTVLLVVASMLVFVRPIALAFGALARRLVLTLGS